MAHRNEDLKTNIIDKLLTGPQHIPALVSEVAAIQNVTIQGVYKAIRTLRGEEVVTLHHKLVSLSGVWIAQEKERLVFAEKAYQSQQSVESIISGGKGKAMFVFHTLNEIDLFWTHAYQIIAEHVPIHEYSYAIQPHDWYYYVRFDTDTYWMKKHAASGRSVRVVVTHSVELDALVIRERKKILKEKFEYTLGENPLGQDSRTYYNLLGPYIFTARFEPDVAEHLDRFIATHDTLPLDISAQKEINDIVVAKGKFTLTIERNEQKAKKMRDKVKKYFEF